MKITAACFACCASCAGCVLPAPAFAQTAKTPPAEVMMCATCHGTQGISQLANAPHLAGQSDIYLTEQLKAYRSGKRQNEVMGVIAKPMTDAQIEATSKWYSSMKIKVVDE